MLFFRSNGKRRSVGFPNDNDERRLLMPSASLSLRSSVVCMLVGQTTEERSGGEAEA